MLGKFVDFEDAESDVPMNSEGNCGDHVLFRYNT